MPVAKAPRDEVVPLTTELRRLHITVSRPFLDKREAARDALSHSHPDGNTEKILEAALDLLLAAQDKKKGIVANPRPARIGPAKDARHVPAAVRRAVWIRDGGKCQWPLASGGVCGSTRRVQLDHIVPVARGGPPTIENTRLLCVTHNGEAARRVFGDAWMDLFTHSVADAHAPPA
jgi:hypothetical protein